jgi:hypothetical protein
MDSHDDNPVAASVIGTRHRTLRLQGVPTWVTPADVRRMAERTGTRGLVDGAPSIIP